MCAGGGRPAVAAIILRVVYCHGDGGAGRRVCCVCAELEFSRERLRGILRDIWNISHIY